MPEAHKTKESAATVNQPRLPGVRSIWGISYIKGKPSERIAKQKEESPQDRLARLITVSTVWMVISFRRTVGRSGPIVLMVSPDGNRMD
jgi:hypothetical protein